MKNLINYNDVLLSIEISRYKINNEICLTLVDAENGEEYLTATVNIMGSNLAPDEVLIKDYSENEGIYKALLKRGFIGIRKRSVTSGYIEAYVCDLLLVATIDEPKIDDDFIRWVNSDNVISLIKNEYQTQCTQYSKSFTIDTLRIYFIKEYCQ